MLESNGFDKIKSEILGKAKELLDKHMDAIGHAFGVSGGKFMFDMKVSLDGVMPTVAKVGISFDPMAKVKDGVSVEIFVGQEELFPEEEK